MLFNVWSKTDCTKKTDPIYWVILDMAIVNKENDGHHNAENRLIYLQQGFCQMIIIRKF